MADYSDKAQPFLDAIAYAAFSHQSVRDWIVQGTPAEAGFTGSRSLHDEQARLRPGTKQPFYCNCWRGKDSRCTCRVPGSRGLETDMMVFFEAETGCRLGVHVEFKHPGEALSFGQAESCPLRARCWANPATKPSRVVWHDEWLTVIFCGDLERDRRDVAPFQRRIGHSEARRMIAGYPA